MQKCGEFYLCKTRDKQAAKHFFKKALRSKPRVITVDKNPAYPIEIEQLKKEKSIPEGMQIKKQKYLNNIVEQDHRFIEKRLRSMLGLKTFQTAKQIICGVEVMHMLKKGKLQQRVKSVKSEIKFIHRLFDLVL